MMAKAEDIIRDLPKGLLSWYDFKEGADLLYITADSNDSLSELLRERKVRLECVCMQETLEMDFLLHNQGRFEYIVAVQVLSQSSDPVGALKAWHSLLSEQGLLLLGMENRLGIRYFCGDRDPYTGRNFDGIEHYRRTGTGVVQRLEGRNYSGAELSDMLLQSGFLNQRSYSVFPGIDQPQLIYAQDYLPKEELGTRYFPRYHDPDTVFLEEECLLTDLANNGLFHKMANSYLIECPLDGSFSNVLHVTVSTDRGRANALATIIRGNQTVEKRALYREGRENLQRLVENVQDLKKNGIKVIEGKLQAENYVMPYVSAESSVLYLRRLLKEDREAFIKEMDRFREIILNSSEHVDDVQEAATGVCLRRGYLDLVPLNSFYIDGEYVFYDQEFYEENYPANAIVYRAVQVIYLRAPEMEMILPQRFLEQRYGLDREIELWRRMENEFIRKLRNKSEMKSFLEKCERNYEVIHTNRQRMNFSQAQYQRLFIDIFKGLENKKLILFGSGNFAKKFLATQKEYPVYAIIDNQEKKWNEQMNGISICSPELLKEMDPEEYKVIICIKDYVSVVKQLKHMGVKHYGIYDINVQYPRTIPTVIRETNKIEGQSEAQKYHVGYIAGVFDLFHIGHLNMFKHAKEQCDYLIVGVVTDEGVRKNKRTEPYVPFEERIEIVRSCRYVDEAVEIPLGYAGTREAYRRYQFDCQFSGSDYINNPDWLGEKTFLEKNGVDMVFFPYTQSTSSTKLKALIEKGLL